MKKAPPVMRESIDRNGKKIEYTWARKPIKNINLRVRSDGSIYLSSPFAMSKKAVEQFLLEHVDFIVSAQKRFEARRAELPTEFHFQSGELLPVFGESIPLLICRGARVKGVLQDGHLMLTVPDPESETQRRRAAELWSKAALKEQLDLFCRRASADFGQFSGPVPMVKIRNMHARWGSCNTKKAILTFNLSLVGAPKEAIEYVVYHEFAHLIYANHSAKFYALVARFLPDWKERKALLRKVPCGLFQIKKTPF